METRVVRKKVLKRMELRCPQTLAGYANRVEHRGKVHISIVDLVLMAEDTDAKVLLPSLFCDLAITPSSEWNQATLYGPDRFKLSGKTILRVLHGREVLARKHAQLSPCFMERSVSAKCQYKQRCMKSRVKYFMAQSSALRIAAPDILLYSSRSGWPKWFEAAQVCKNCTMFYAATMEILRREI